MYSYDYPRPMITVDIIAYVPHVQKILLITRKNEPFQGYQALPGGYLDMEETACQAAVRELREETGLKVETVEFLGYYDAVSRDPRGRTVTLTFYTLLDKEGPVSGSSDAVKAEWIAVDSLPKLAFDHERMLEDFRMKVGGRLV